MRIKNKFFIPTPAIALLIYCLAIVTLIMCLKHATLLFAPVFFSFVISYLFNPVVNFLEKKTSFSRGAVAGLVMIALVFIMIFVLMNLLPYVVDEAKLAADKFPGLMLKFSEKMESINKYLQKNFSAYIGSLDLVSEVENLLKGLKSNLSSMLAAIFSGLYSVLLTVLFLVFIPLISFYFLKDANKIKETFFGLVPPRYQQQVIHRIEQLDDILSSFIRGQAIVVVILAVFYSVGLSFIQLPFAVLIGVLAGIGDIIPYMGTIIGFIVSLIVGLAHFQSVDKLLLIVMIFALVKGSENWYFYPKIVGREVGLHFVWVLVSIVVFGNVFGFWGLLVAIPSAAGFKLFVKDLVKYYKNSAYFKKEKT